MKLISVPIDKDAEKRLEYYQNVEFDLIDFYLNDVDHDFIWKTDFYNDVNSEIGVLIDDYEDEEITGKENLRKLHSIIEKYEKIIINNPTILTLKSLTEAAIRFDTGVYFFF